MKLNFKRPPTMAVIVLLVILVIAASCTGLLLMALSKPLPELQPLTNKSLSVGTIDNPSIQVDWSPYGQQVLELAGTPFSASNNVPGTYATASTSKVMMALLILQKLPLKNGEQGPNIPVGQDTVDQYQQELALNESVVAVTAGEQLSEYQALQAILVPSATNIADLLATSQFGSISAYAAVANQMASKLGMNDTHFADASGFDPGTTSTASDLVKLGAAALQNPVIAQIVNQQQVSLPVAGTLSNFNIVLGQSGINGIKTGNTDQAGGVFLYSAPYKGHTVIGATMNAPDLGTALHDAPELIQDFEASIKSDTPVKAGEAIGSYSVPWANANQNGTHTSLVNAVAAKDLSVLDVAGTKITVHAKLNHITGNQAQNSNIGTVTFTYNGQTQTSPVILNNAIPKPSFWWRVKHGL